MDFWNSWSCCKSDRDEHSYENPIVQSMDFNQAYVGNSPTNKHKVSDNTVRVDDFPWHDGSTYTGQMQSGKRHGDGKQVWEDGSRYQGQWHQDNMHGKGVFSWPDGRSYDGAYENNLKHGQGRFMWPDGRWFYGDWVDGKQHGQGQIFDKQEILHGVWEKGKRIK